MIVATVTDTIPDLVVLPKAKYRSLLIAAMRGSGEIGLFEHPDLIDRTHRELLSMQREAQTSLATLRDDLLIRRYELLTNGERAKWQEEQAEFAKKRKAKRWYLNGVEETLMRVKSMVREHRAITLEAAIRRHRDGFSPADKASDLDRDLWEQVR